MAKLNDMIREFRESINQSIEAVAMLMQMNPEQYARLEEDWVPPDNIIQRLCTLFEWNYQDVRRIALQEPRGSSVVNASVEMDSSSQGEIGVASPESGSFHEQLKNAREQVGQSAEGMATLLGTSAEYYLALEDSVLPDDDLLRRICSLFTWNFKQVRQKILTRHNPVFASARPPLSADEMQVESTGMPQPEIAGSPEPKPLGQRLREAREEVEQTPEGLALLLQVNPEYYALIEAGETVPDQQLLKRIAAVFRWNYHELLKHEQRSSRGRLPSTFQGLRLSAKSDSERELRAVMREISEGWQNLGPEKQRSLLAQLELIRDTVNTNKPKQRR